MSTLTRANTYHRRINARHTYTYDVVLCDRLFADLRPELADAGSEVDGRRRRFVIIDSEVAKYHGPTISTYFDCYNIFYEPYIIDVAPELTVLEEIKQLQTVLDLINALHKFDPLRRGEPPIVIGGGVVRDIVAFVCSLYRRGTPYIVVPTTTVGAVDAGVAGKTGVNHLGSKNLIGTYWPPVLVLIDRALLASLPERHITNGIAEMYKVFLTCDAVGVDLLEIHGAQLLRTAFQSNTVIGYDDNGHPRIAEVDILARAIDPMLDELEANMLEVILKRLMDFGHTFGPKLEMAAMPDLLHGESVMIDMVAFARVSAEREDCEFSHDDLARMMRIAHTLKLPTTHPLLTPALIHKGLTGAIKYRDGNQNMPLLHRFGQGTFAQNVTMAELTSAAEWMSEHGRPSPFWEIAA